MGKHNIVVGEYLSDPERFADMCNGIYFQGKQVMGASELVDADPVLYFSGTKNGEEARPDHVKRWIRQEMTYAILISEDQDKTNYRMVLRVQLTEAIHYRKQWKEKQREHKRKKDLKTPEEFLSGMGKDEKFIPVVTLVINLGEKPWDGPRTLHELLELNEENAGLKAYVNDYKLNIFDYHDYDNFDMFHTELRAVFEFLRYSQDEEKLKNTVENNTELYYNISEETYDLITELTNSRARLPLESKEKYKTEGEKINMCKALDDIWEDGKKQGISQGIMQTITEQTLCKLKKGKSAEEIAADLEKEISFIQRIINVAQNYAPEYDVALILAELNR